MMQDNTKLNKRKEKKRCKNKKGKEGGGEVNNIFFNSSKLFII
jgi:hypothetical protein